MQYILNFWSTNKLYNDIKLTKNDIHVLNYILIMLNNRKILQYIGIYLLFSFIYIYAILF